MRRAVLGAALAGLAGCGYSVGGLYPEKNVRVETFDNVSERRTHEFELTNAVVHEMTARGFRVNRADAPLVLKGRILDLRTPSLVDQKDTDEVLVSSLRVKMEISCLDREGKERWRDERVESVLFVPSRGGTFDTARMEAYDRLARWVVSRFEKDW